MCRMMIGIGIVITVVIVITILIVIDLYGLGWVGLGVDFFWNCDLGGEESDPCVFFEFFGIQFVTDFLFNNNLVVGIIDELVD